VIHGNRFTGVLNRMLGLHALPMQIAAGLAIAFAVVIRERVWLWLAGAAFAWIAIEVGFALHGWSAASRYLFEPEAVFVVLAGAGAGVGRALALGPAAPKALRLTAVAAVAALVVALIPTVALRTRTIRREVRLRRTAAVQIHRLEDVIRREGGPARIRACGRPVTIVGWQSTLAWETGLNVGNVGYKPGRSIAKGDPIVLFKPHRLGWQVRPIHTVAPNRAACASLRTDTAFG